MKKQITSPQAAAPGGPYSPAIVANGFVFISGCTGHLPGPEKKLVTSSFRDQAEQVFKNLDILAQTAGTSLSESVRATVYLKDMANFAEMNELFGTYLGPVGPTRTALPIALEGFDIEIDLILALPTGTSGQPDE